MARDLPNPLSRSAQRRPTLALGLTASWSLICALAGLLWTTGTLPYPLAAADPQADLSILGGVRRDVAAPAIAAFGAAGLLVIGSMMVSERPPRRRVVLLAWAWGSAIVLATVIPDYRLLVLVAYAPIFLVAAPLGLLPPGVSLFDALTPPVAVQAASTVGGVAWAFAARGYASWSRERCAGCGADAGSAFHRVDRARRWGRAAVAVAVAVPLVYAATRYAWALGIPFGVSDEFLRQGEANGMWVAGAALATVATLGAILTLGLVARWGEVFPRWMPFVGRRRVPVNLAVIPAIVVAALVTSAGLMFIRLVLREGLERFGAENWGAVAPELIWPVWGIALATAALAYRQRRTGPDDSCTCDDVRPPVAGPATTTARTMEVSA